MSLLHSEAEAALLEAGALSHRLAERYQLAVEHLSKDTSPESAGSHRDELVRRFARHAEQLALQADELDDAARARDLLPREPETELETLKQLADHLQTVLSDEQLSGLSRRFAEEEQALLDELEQAAELDPCPSAVKAGIEAGRKRRGKLAH